MEMIIGAVVMAVLFLLAFFAGMRVADRYTDRQIRATEYALKKQFERLRTGVDIDDPVQPYVSPDER